MVEDELSSPSLLVRWVHAAVGALLGVLLAILWLAGGTAGINWSLVALGGLMGALIFFAVGTWLLSALAEWFRWF